MEKSHNISRRKFLELFGCSCCGMFVTSCATVPISKRKQLTLYPESVLNRQAARAYEKFKSKAKLIRNESDLNNIIYVGERIQKAVKNFFLKKNLTDPTENFSWEYILVDNKILKKQQ